MTMAGPLSRVVRSPRAMGRRSPAWAGVWLTLLGLLASACGKRSNEPEVALTTISGERCSDGSVACGDSCVHLASSAQNCGGCGNVCASGDICDRGRCHPAAAGCSLPTSLCGSDCVDVASDEQHCGGCGNACPSTASCSGSICACPGSESVCGSECVDTQSDEQHCGSCGTACVSTQTCEAGACACPGGEQLCGQSTLSVVDAMVTTSAGVQTCVNTQTDAQHCGTCGNVCSGGQVCDTGTCACPTGQTLCGDSCVDTRTSLANCGSCGNACSGGQQCAMGSCECPDGQSFCDGQCIDTQTDEAHCGSCTVACGLGQGCDAGACQSGAPGEDGCQGLAQNLSIAEVAAYQTVKVSLAQNGQGVQANPRMVAKRNTLFRVFVTPGTGWAPRELSARLFLQDLGGAATPAAGGQPAPGGTAMPPTMGQPAGAPANPPAATPAAGGTPAAGARVLTQYSESTLTITAASQEQDRGSTFEFLVPPENITADTRFAVEVVECGSGAGTQLAPRYPATDAADLDAVDSGGLKLHFVPLRANGLLPDTSETALSVYRRAFLATYPVSAVDISVGDPFDIADDQDWSGNLDRVRTLRQQQQPAGDTYYYGLLRPANTFREACGGGCVAGIGYVPNPQRLNAGQRASMGLAYADNNSSQTILHEIGHNHGRQHAPCGNVAGADQNFPQANGSIGVYGYNALGDQLIQPNASDIMGYCNNKWFSVYTYTGLLNTVLTVNRVQASVVADPARVGDWNVLLVDAARGGRWGSPLPSASEAAGEEEPALVYDAAGVLVDTVSVYRTNLSDLAASSLEVPAPKPGWHSIEVSGAPRIQFAPAP
jgi:hypothetical protein